MSVKMYVLLLILWSSHQCFCLTNHAITEKNSTFSAGYQYKNLDNNTQPSLIESVEDLCRFFNISEVFCSCKLFAIGGENKIFNSVCELELYWNSSYNILTNDLSTSKEISSICASSFGILGNAAVIINILRRKGRLKSYKKIILRLACYDFIFALIQFIHVLPNFWTHEWLYGIPMCKVLRTSEILGSYLAIGVILQVTVERYNGIVRPLHRFASTDSHRGLEVLNILFGMICVLPLFLQYQINEFNICRLHWSIQLFDSLTYEIFSFCVYFVLPVTTMSVLYFKIFRAFKASMRHVIHPMRIRLEYIRKNKRRVKMICCVVIAFIVLVLQKHVMSIYFGVNEWSYDLYLRKMQQDSYFYLTLLAHIAYPIHVVINPLLYSLCSKNIVGICERISRYTKEIFVR